MKQRAKPKHKRRALIPVKGLPTPRTLQRKKQRRWKPIPAPLMTEAEGKAKRALHEAVQRYVFYGERA